MTSYQNGLGPRKIEEIGISAESLQRRKTSRRLLFTGIGAALFLTFGFMALMLQNHQQAAHQAGLFYYDDDDNVEGGGGGFKRTYDEDPIGLDYLNLRTNISIPSGCETTIVLIRHCEKEGPETVDQDGNEHCSYVGYERAHFLPTLFGTDGGRWPAPAALFALESKRGAHYNFREVETVVPLANKYGLSIESESGNQAASKHLFQGMADGEWCGKSIVVSWKHELMVDLALQLGCTDCPDDYPFREFDEVWQLKYVYDVAGTPIIRSSHVHPNNPTPPLSHPSPDNHNLRRDLRKNKKDRVVSDKVWSVYSTITHQNFDPLKFSNSVGDYNGGKTGGKWYTAGSSDGGM